MASNICQAVPGLLEQAQRVEQYLLRALAVEAVPARRVCTHMLRRVGPVRTRVDVDTVSLMSTSGYRMCPHESPVTFRVSAIQT